MSFWSGALHSVNNDQLPQCTHPPQPRSLTSRSNSTLIPFYIHLKPSQLLHQRRDQHPLVAHTNHYDLDQQRIDSSQPIGFLRVLVVKALLDDNQNIIQSHLGNPCWKFLYPSPSPHHDDDLPCCVCFEDWINFNPNRLEIRNKHLDRLVRGWKESGLFLDQLSGWRNECYSIYGPKAQPVLDDNDETLADNVAFKIERAAVGLFGFLSFGAHLTAYVKKNGQYFFWIPTRSPTKPTWPSKLDNTVAGGIASGETPLETILRESVEEASFPQDFVRSNLVSTGIISYTHRNQFGWIQPEIQYTYDLELPSSGEIIPKPNDGETQDFRLMDKEQVFLAIKLNQFKPNCAAVLIDFFVRHGLLNPSNLHDFCLVSTALKVLPGLPLP